MTRRTQQVPNAEAAIRMQKVVKTFKNAAGEFTVLKGIDLSLAQGEFVAIVGKSGSGKSTLLNMITGIDHPTGGQVIINGVDIYRMNESQRSLWRGRNLGIVFQFFQLLPMLTLLENVMLPMDYVGTIGFDERPRRAMELLAMVGLETEAHKLPAAVSTGQQQSAAIARALATDPPIICADEPTGNLDSRSADVIISLFDRLVEGGKTIAMVTHDPSLTERTSRTIIISDGELVDETLARCLPFLDHRQMLEATHLLEHRVYKPNAPIIEQDGQVEHYFMIIDGGVEVTLGSGEGKRTLARLGAGESFGEVELLRGGLAIAGVQAAAGTGVELVALPRIAFQGLVERSPQSAEALARAAEMRLAQHHALEQQTQGGRQ